MSPLTRVESTLRALCALFLTAAALAAVWRPAVPSSEIAPAGLDTLPGKRSPMVSIDPALAQRVVAANIFSSSRSAPRQRYRLHQNESPQFGPSVPSPEPRSRPQGEGVPQLFGTLLGPAGATALMRLDPAIPDAQLYREGDRAGNYLVEKINERSVVLSSPRGRVELRLIQSKGPTP
ncbi:MAG: hypothetical protein ACRENP_29450 [Longimicrobiales bacterium]